MPLEEIKLLPVGDLSEPGTHLWLWTTNRFLHDGFHLLEHWGFTYLAPITWVKPSGFGAWFVHRTQTLLFGYRKPCRFSRERYKPTVIHASVQKFHSRKPEESYRLIESISDPQRLELFARQQRSGWDVWGNEVESTVVL